MSESRSFRGSKRKIIYAQCDGECFFCHKIVKFKEMHVDHLIAWKRGGATTYQNGVVSCVLCNRLKRDKTHIQFIKEYGGCVYRVSRTRIERFVRCHGFTKNGLRCKKAAQKSSRQTLYCPDHNSSS